MHTYSQIIWIKTFTKWCHFVLYLLVMRSSSHRYSGCSSFTAAEPLLQAQVVNCIALNLNLSEAAHQMEWEIQSSHLCVSGTVGCAGLWRLFQKVEEMQFGLTSFESHYLVILRSIETFVTVLSCCDKWSWLTVMILTFINICSVLFYTFKFLPKCAFCPICVRASWNCRSANILTNKAASKQMHKMKVFIGSLKGRFAQLFLSPLCQCLASIHHLLTFHLLHSTTQRGGERLTD